MSGNKLNQVHVYIIGGVLMLILFVGLYFALIKPLQDQTTALAASVAQVEQEQIPVGSRQFTNAQLEEARKELDAVKANYQQKKAELAAREEQKQLPPSQRIDLGKGTRPELIARTLPRWIALPRVVVRQMASYAKSSARKYGVEVQTAFAAPAPSTNPDAIPRDIIPWTLGGMSIKGEFNKVMSWVENWNNAPLLVSVDGLKCNLAGRNGVVQATASLTAFIFPTGEAVTNPGNTGAAPGGAPMGMGTGGMGMEIPGPGGMAGTGGMPGPSGLAGGAPPSDTPAGGAPPPDR